jgi:acyl carrier protein
MRDVERTVRRLIAEKLSVSAAEIPLDAHVERDLGATSLDGVEMILTLEEEYHIEVPDERAAEIKTVRDLIEALDEGLMFASRSAETEVRGNRPLR